MCLVCTATQAPVCAGGACNVGFWQQNINLLIIVLTPVIGGIGIWMKNLWLKMKKK